MKNHTEPNTMNPATAAPFLIEDVMHLLDTHAVRIDHSMKRRGSWRHRDVKTVRRAIRSWLHHQHLPTGGGHAVSLYWLHHCLTYGPDFRAWYEDGGTIDPDAAMAAHRAIVAALNQSDSGLQVVPQRWTQVAS